MASANCDCLGHPRYPSGGQFPGAIFIATTLGLHTLLIFLAVLSGVVASGPSGFVLRPVGAVAVAAFEIQRGRIIEGSVGCDHTLVDDQPIGCTKWYTAIPIRPVEMPLLVPRTAASVPECSFRPSY